MAARRRSTGADLNAAFDRAKGDVALLRESIGAAEPQAIGAVLAAAIAHEVRNIATPVRAFAQLALANSDDTDLAAKALAVSVSGAERICRITEVMIAASKGGLSGGSARIANAVRGAEQFLAPPTSPFHVKHSIDSHLAAAINPVALEQVLLNLLLNARAATGTKAAAEITAETTAGRVRIEILDSGPGIGSAMPERTHSGSGLGLVVCRFLIEAAGGSLEVMPRLGGGTCVAIELPAAHAAAAAA